MKSQMIIIKKGKLFKITFITKNIGITNNNNNEVMNIWDPLMTSHYMEIVLSSPIEHETSKYLNI